MSINRHHGGAIEDCGRYLGSLLEAARTSKRSIDEVATAEVTRIKSSGDRISGLGTDSHQGPANGQAV